MAVIIAQFINRNCTLCTTWSIIKSISLRQMRSFDFSHTTLKRKKSTSILSKGQERERTILKSAEESVMPVIYNQPACTSFLSFFFFLHRTGDVRKADLRWDRSMRWGATMGRRNYTVLGPILRVIPRYYGEIIIIDCLLAA